MQKNSTVLKPPHLRAGDTIGIISPSWGGAGLFPHRMERGIAQIEALGFRARIAPHALNNQGYVSDTAQHRAEDIHTLLNDPEVRAIVAAIGGDHACHLLPCLDFDLIRRFPKIFMGFSDFTVLNVAIWARTGLVTFNGPAILTDFAEFPAMFEFTRESMLGLLCTPQPVGAVQPSGWWTEEFLDWEQKKDLLRPRILQPSPGRTWLKPGCAEGILIGGCIESLEHLRGTPWWPDWQGAFLFFETSEEAPPPERVDGILMDYENMGVMEQLNGMLVGRPMRYSEEQKEELRQVVLERTRKYNFPIVTDMDFGHTSPQVCLPIGCRARIDSNRQVFEVLEAAVS